MHLVMAMRQTLKMTLLLEKRLMDFEQIKSIADSITTVDVDVDDDDDDDDTCVRAQYKNRQVGIFHVLIVSVAFK